MNENDWLNAYQQVMREEGGSMLPTEPERTITLDWLRYIPPGHIVLGMDSNGYPITWDLFDGKPDHTLVVAEDPENAAQVLRAAAFPSRDRKHDAMVLVITPDPYRWADIPESDNLQKAVWWENNSRHVALTAMEAHNPLSWGTYEHKAIVVIMDEIERLGGHDSDIIDDVITLLQRGPGRNIKVVASCTGLDNAHLGAVENHFSEQRIIYGRHGGFEGMASFPIGQFLYPTGHGVALAI